jgi:hypothetical protein
MGMAIAGEAARRTPMTVATNITFNFFIAVYPQIS